MNEKSFTFISYSRANSDFALKLAKELKSSGFDVWLDQLDIPAGVRWDDEIQRALEDCDVFMVILTPASAGSENVKDEIGYAIDSGKRILPVLLEKSDIPFRLRRLQYVDFTKKNHQEGFESAKRILRTMVVEPPPISSGGERSSKTSEDKPPVHLFGIGAVAALLLLWGIWFLTRQKPDGVTPGELTATPPVMTAGVQATFQEIDLENTLAPEPSSTPTKTPAITPTPTKTPTPTPHVVITDIRLDHNLYVVEYGVHNFPESPQLHVHMFFDTVPPEQAGSPGSGPWKLTWGPYGDPPFTEYGVANRPVAATQMCALVANPDHSIRTGTGNCINLP